jgi:hypothetical protein
MKAYAEYASRLDELLDRVEWGHHVPTSRSELIHNLNGGAAEALRELVSSAAVSESGAFFTPELLAQVSLKTASTRTTDGPGAVLDPALGAGDLLLRWAHTLPVHNSLERTLEIWGASLCGFELHREFISVAKRRLTLLAVHRGAKLLGSRAPKWNDLFPRFLQSDFIASKRPLPAVTSVVMNPPFIMIPAPARCEWASGAVNAAAVFVDRVLAQLPPDKRIIAILPEVLRSGTRYLRWRELVARRMSILRCEPRGLFSDHADVDVFILEGVTTHSAGAMDCWPSGQRKAGRSVLGDVADVTVGPVVPHRHKKKGLSLRYITAKSLPRWKTLHRIKNRRRFSGTLFTPPFVAVRRTSSPHDPERAVGTLVAGKKPVAVENHLLVVKPTTATLKDCHRILQSLKNRSTTAWLNNRIRCRHLTVGVLKGLPLFEN